MRLPVLWHPTVHFPFSQMGCYQEGIAKDSVGGKDVTAHIYEWVFRGVVHTSPSTSRHRYTTNVIVTDTGEVSKGSCPVQVLFCLKEQNKKKLNSHRWFFNAFAPLLKPNGMYWFNVFVKSLLTDPEVCVLLDVGTKPTGTSIYELWKCEVFSSQLTNDLHFPKASINTLMLVVPAESKWCWVTLTMIVVMISMQDLCRCWSWLWSPANKPSCSLSEFRGQSAHAFFMLQVSTLVVQNVQYSR